MLDALRNRIIEQVKRADQRDEDQLYVFLTTLMANLFCLTVHLYLMVVFLVAGQGLFALINACSLLVYGVTSLLFRWHKYRQIALIISLEVTVYAALVGFLAGIATYIVGYLVLVVLLQALIPYASGRFRVFMVGVQIVCAAVLVGYHVWATPPFVFSERLNNVLLASNIAVLFVGSTAELYLSNIVRIMVADLNRLRVAELTDKANMDPLTGLYNRRYADDYFEELCKRGKTCCFAMLDVDNFKYVNDQYGHAAGDQLLTALAEHLTKNLRRSDAIFRWGGDEFLIVLEDTTLPIAHNVLQTLHQGLGRLRMPAPAQEVMPSFTIGVAQLRQQDVEECIRESDEQLYKGKQQGKNRVVSAIGQ